MRSGPEGGGGEVVGNPRRREIHVGPAPVAEVIQHVRRWSSFGTQGLCRSLPQEGVLHHGHSPKHYIRIHLTHKSLTLHLQYFRRTNVLSFVSISLFFKECVARGPPRRKRCDGMIERSMTTARHSQDLTDGLLTHRQQVAATAEWRRFCQVAAK